MGPDMCAYTRLGLVIAGKVENDEIDDFVSVVIILGEVNALGIQFVAGFFQQLGRIV